MIGKTISHYNVLEKLGEGGMGVVYKAEDTKLKRDVAIKFLTPDLTKDSSAKERFLREAQAISKLNHPHIATIHDLVQEEQTDFIVLEYLEGGTLKEKLKERQFTISEILGFAIQIAEGLSHAHHRSIVHRDIKTDNVMLTGDGQLKITDFGLAKLRDVTKVTKTGSTVGTADYMSPEQAQNFEVDHRSDIYSFGVVLYELITGELPFRASHEVALLYEIVHGAPKPIGDCRPDIPPELAIAVEKAMSKSVENRYQSVDEMLVDLRAINSRFEPSHGEKRRTISYLDTRKLAKILIPSFAAIAIIAIAVVLLLSPSGRPSKDLPSIAVLPLKNMSDSKENEYFSDGMTEDIIAQLSKISDLRVISRTSVMVYKNTQARIKDIAHDLNVATILEGSIRREGDKTRIVVQLIDASDDEHLWAETYDRDLTHFLDVQSDVAQKIVGTLKVKLTAREKERLTRVRTIDPKVYNLLLQGRYFFRRRTAADLRKAIDLYNQALAIDSNSADVLADLSYAYDELGRNGYMRTSDAYERARIYAEDAVSLDDDLSDAHQCVGSIKQAYDWDWEGAEREFRKALALEPGRGGINIAMGSLMAALGRFDEAVSFDRKAIELNPLFTTAYTNLANHLLRANRPQESVPPCQKALELSPGYPTAHNHIAMAYLLQGKVDSALNEIPMETSLPWRLHGLALAYEGAHRRVESDTALNGLVLGYGIDAAFQIAEIYGFRGRNDSAFVWLERAYAQRDGGLAEIIGDPFLRTIERDPRYAAFLNKMKLPVR